MTEIFQSIPVLMKGLIVTVQIFALTIVLSLPLGFLTALARISRFKPLGWLTATYIWILRGTPLLLQLIFVYFGLPYIGITFDSFTAAVIAFVLNYSVYFAEIFRAGIRSIDKGQYEASKALGLTSSQTMTKIIIPQMDRLVLPPVSNETITLVKDTAIVYYVTLVDLMRATQLRVMATSDITPFAIAGAIYLVMTLILTVFFSKLEKRLCLY
jgi:polar amino acid transport system permease protein